MVKIDLDIFGIGLYVRGCLTSPSAESEVWDWCVETLQRKLSQDDEDHLWALVYRYCFSDYMNTPYREKMLQMLAAYNIRNRACIIVKHPDTEDRFSLYAYRFRGVWHPLHSMTKVIPEDMIVMIRHEDRFDSHYNAFLGIVKPECFCDMDIYK